MDPGSERTGPPAEILRRLESVDSLPTLSPVALKLVELASDESCSAAERQVLEGLTKDGSLR